MDKEGYVKGLNGRGLLLYNKQVSIAEIYNQKNVPKSIVRAAVKYKKLLPGGQEFSEYIQFPENYLNRLPKSVIKYREEEDIPEIFTIVGNKKNPSLSERKKYFAELMNAYTLMGNVKIDKNTLVIGPQREGAILTKELGWDKKAKEAMFPHAKRIPYEHGIVVGLSDLNIKRGLFKKAAIIDGAIASGSTLMAIMLAVKKANISDISIYAVHAPEHGLRILDQFAAENKIKLTIHVAYVSGAVNEKFYAVYPKDHKKQIVGDLGDAIGPLFSNNIDKATYDAWKGIDHKPAVKSFFPDELMKYLTPESKVLEIGCDKGTVCLGLSKKGFDVTGLDISSNSIKYAKESAKDKNLKVKFITSDFLDSEVKESFDAILLIRVLTCMPNPNSWEKSLKKIFKMLPKGALFYVHDFVYSPEGYKKRYEEGMLSGLRKGTFRVFNDDGSLNFIAHHHSKEEITRIKKDYEVLSYKEHKSLSMNGNPVKMFELIGRKK